MICISSWLEKTLQINLCFDRIDFPAIVLMKGEKWKKYLMSAVEEISSRCPPLWGWRDCFPVVTPKKYWDLYDRQELPLAPNPFLPENAPVYAMNSAYELTACYDLEWVKHPFVEKLSEQLKAGWRGSC